MSRVGGEFVPQDATHNRPLPYPLLFQEASKKGASASDWANAVSGVVGGKAGGKAPTSIGSGTNVDKVDEAVAVATKYLEGFHL